MNLPRHRLMNPPRHRLMKPRYCLEVGFTRPHSTQADVLSKLPAFWKSVAVKATTSEQNTSWTTVGYTSPSTSPLRHLISITSPRPMIKKKVASAKVLTSSLQFPVIYKPASTQRNLISDQGNL
ncbi:hypothetical protein E2C01_001809 [Portunus trituberculatus]|uniref:Uncharacterized protein n=1 Tax=Portunus trituberculatus TaxID=210409 RepID=A0A5B7CLC0_PORTR|nr:hypothetical protein [Portunus trituberculatus]